MSQSALVFQNTTFDVVDRNGDAWLRGYQIGTALGYASQPDTAVRKIFDRHADEFTDDMTALVKLPTEGGEQEVRIFSPRGCYALAMFARTKVAKEFRKWVLDVLESIRKTGRYEAAPYSVNASDTLTKEQQDTLRNLLTEAAKQRFPDNTKKQGAFIMRGWSKMKAHFKVGYREIPAVEFTEAVSIAARHAVEGEYLPRDEHASLNQTVEHWAKQIESGNGVPAEVFEPIARAVLKKKPSLNNGNAPTSESALLAAAQKALCAGHRFYTIFREGSAPGEILPILVPLPSNCHMLTPQEVVEEIASNGTGFFKDGHIKDIICAIGTRLKAA